MSETEALRYLALAEQAEAERRGPGGDAWYGRMRDERPHLLDALEWMITNGADEEALRLAGALGPFWDYEFVEGGREWIGRVLALPGAQEPTIARARALLYAGVLAFRMGHQSAADAQIEESLSIARQLGDKKAQSLALSAYARNALRDEDHEAVRTRAEEAMRLALEIGDRRSAASARHMLAYSAAMQGELDRASTLYHENQRVGHELGDKSLIATETGNLAYLEFDRGNFDAAREGFRAYVRMSQEMEDEPGVADALLGFGMLEIAAGNTTRGVTILGATQAAFDRIGTSMDPGTQKDFDASAAQAKEQISEDDYQVAYEEGLAMDLRAASAYAIGTGQ